MNLATGYCFNNNEIFDNFDLSKVKLNSKLCEKIFNDRHIRRSMGKIFANCMQIIINDIIDNNTTFNLPTGKMKSNIHVHSVKDKLFIAGRQHGKWQDIDFLSSNFSANLLMIEIDKRKKPMYVSGKEREKLVNNTNNGKQYC